MTTAISKWVSFTAAWTIAVGIFVGAQADKVLAQDRRKDAEAERINAATSVLGELMSVEGNAIPRAVLDKAEAIAIFPTMPRMPRRRGQGPNTLKTARLLEVSARGILSVRSGNPVWSTPAFLTLDDVELPRDADVVLVAVSRRGLESLARHEFAFDSEAAVAPGPIVQGSNAWTETQRRADVFTYSRTRGVLEGISLAGSRVQADTFANQRFYGQRWVAAGTNVEPANPAPITAWRVALEKHATR